MVASAAVVGAGTMGGQIAQVLAAAGIDVLLSDVSEPALEAGLETARAATERAVVALVDRGALDAAAAEPRIAETVGRIATTTGYDGFAAVDLAIEAVPERIELKRAVFAELDAVVPGHAILASNTSALSITELGAATVRPDKVVGLHFFFPADVMPLVEVVRGDETSPETVAAAYAFALALRKQPIVCADAPGFVVNRVLTAGVSELWRAQEHEGLSIAALDEAIAAQGVAPMPPFALADMLGLDTTLRVAERLVDAFGDRFHVHRGIAELVADGRLGDKSGGGLFVDGAPAIAGDVTAVDGAALAERVELRALVEACLVVEEGVCAVREVDLGLIAGAGLDPRRGFMPPFLKADATGLDVVLGRLEELERVHGERFAPPRTLRRLVAQGRLGPAGGQGFYAYPRPDAEADQTATVALETRGPVAIAWLGNGPLNTLSPAVIADLRTVWERVAAGPARALVLASGSPFAFSAGADVRAFAALGADGIAAFVDEVHALFGELERGDVATIAAVNGVAFGGGTELALACDVRLAAASAAFGQPEIKLGIIPGWGGTQRLGALVGRGRARELQLLGDPLLAVDAYEQGLVNRVVPDHELLDVALAWARRLAEQAPRAVAAIKDVAVPAQLDDGLAAERAAFAALLGSDDAAEGLAAFRARRRPRWTGR